MKLTVKDNFRKFSKGDVFNFSAFDEDHNGYDHANIMFMVGDNGTGKSTLMKAMRSLVTDYGKTITGEKRSREMNYSLSSEITECVKHIELSGFERYEMIIAMDGEKDDNMRFDVSGSAEDLFDSGGYAMQKLSNGMRSAASYVKFVEMHRDNIIPGKTLVLLDEVDKGWMLKYAVNMTDQIWKNFSGCDVIVVTHNPLCWMSSMICEEVYDIEQKRYVDVDEYFYSKTGLYMNISYADINKIIKKASKKMDELQNTIRIYRDKYGELTDEDKKKLEQDNAEAY